MSTYKELIYMVLDELKLSSDDSYYTEEHVAFLLNKYRALALKQQYKDIKKEIPESNFQTMCVSLDVVEDNIPCNDIPLLISKQKVPNLLTTFKPQVFLDNDFIGDITFVSKERLKYTGNNKWLKHIIYAAIGNDNYLYIKSSNPQYKYLKSLKIKGIFENPEEVASSCNTENNNTCDPYDAIFPLDDALTALVIPMVVKELSGGLYKPEDSINSGSDDLSTLATYLRNIVNKKKYNIDGVDDDE